MGRLASLTPLRRPTTKVVLVFAVLVRSVGDGGVLLPMHIHLRLSVNLSLDRVLVLLLLVAQFVLKILRVVFLLLDGNRNVDWLEDEDSFFNYTTFSLLLSCHFIKLFFGDYFMFDCFFEGDLLRLSVPSGRLTESSVVS
jgi:hypothetical protein